MRAANEDITSERHESPPAQSLAGCALSTNDFKVLFCVAWCFAGFGLVCAHMLVRCFGYEVQSIKRQNSQRAQPPPLRLARAKNASARCHQDHQVFTPARIGKAPPTLFCSTICHVCSQQLSSVFMSHSWLTFFAEPN